MAKSPGLDELLEEITTDAYGDHEIFWAFRQAIADEIRFPCDGLVIGESVSVLGIDYTGNERRGLIATCRRKDGSRHTVSAADLVLATQGKGTLILACYRKWLGLEPFAKGLPSSDQETGRDRIETAIAGNEHIEFVVLSVKQMSARCRLLHDTLEVTFRTGYTRDLIPGEIVTLRPGKIWNYARNTYLTGKIESTRLDLAPLALVPLKLVHFGAWDPQEHYWGEQGEAIEEWARPIIVRGVRPSYEMEQVLPGLNPDDYDNDPICNAVELNNSGDHDAADKILSDLCQQDLRCLDAHAHFGNFCFDYAPETALRHFEVGMRIGELSLGADFDGLLAWGLVDNRPFLRCMYGYGLCLWRLGRFEEAERIFDRMLWLNPTDNQGVRFEISDVKVRKPWELL